MAIMRQLEPKTKSGTDFVPIAALRRRLDDLARQFHFSVLEDEDDLGPVRYAYLQTDEGHAFLLRRYPSYPEEIVDLFIPNELSSSRDVLDEIIDELHVPRRDVMRTKKRAD